jgi:hypothetical protein
MSNTAPDAARQGWEHFHAGRWPDARALATRAVSADPGHAPAWHLLGLLDFREGQPAEVG